MASSEFPFHNLVFEGGGVLGIAYAGALAVLEEEGILDQVERVAGTSVGAITALTVALRFDADTIRNILLNLDFEKFLTKAEPVQLPKKYGWYNKEPIADWLMGLIRDAGVNFAGSPALRGDETFRELAALGAREMRVFATNLNLRQAVEFSLENTPDICVRDAVLASIAIPLFFQAFQFPDNAMQGHIFVDGGLIINYPIMSFDEEGPNPATLGFKFERRQKYASNDLQFGQMRGWAQNIYEIVKNIQGEYLRYLPHHLKRTISIDVDAVEAIDFDLAQDDKKWLMDNGRRATEFYLQRFRNRSRFRYKLLGLLRLNHKRKSKYKK